jgi:hypothetical protein
MMLEVLLCWLGVALETWYFQKQEEMEYTCSILGFLHKVRPGEGKTLRLLRARHYMTKPTGRINGGSNHFLHNTHWSGLVQQSCISNEPWHKDPLQGGCMGFVDKILESTQFKRG